MRKQKTEVFAMSNENENNDFTINEDALLEKLLEKSKEKRNVRHTPANLIIIRYEKIIRTAIKSGSTFSQIYDVFLSEGIFDKCGLKDVAKKNTFTNALKKYFGTNAKGIREEGEEIEERPQTKIKRKAKKEPDATETAASTETTATSTADEVVLEEPIDYTQTSESEEIIDENPIVDMTKK